MKKLIKKILKEDRRQMFLDKIVHVMKNDFPLFKNMEIYGFYDQLSEEELNYVFSEIFGEPVKIRGYVLFNENRRRIYEEDSDGHWKKYEYGDNGKVIYYKNSQGRKWYKI